MKYLGVSALLLAFLLAGSARAGGVLEICANRTAKVYLDGEEVGVTPLKLVAVAEGHHVVKVKGEGNLVATEEVDFPKAGTVEKTIAFNFPQKEESVTVTPVHTVGSKDLLVEQSSEPAAPLQVLRGQPTPAQTFPELSPPQPTEEEVAETSTVVEGSNPADAIPPLDTAVVGAPQSDLPPPPPADAPETPVGTADLEPSVASAYGDPGALGAELPSVGTAYTETVVPTYQPPPAVFFYTAGGTRRPIVSRTVCPPCPDRRGAGPIHSGVRLGRGFGGGRRGMPGNFNQVGRISPNRAAWASTAQPPAFRAPSQMTGFRTPAVQQPMYRSPAIGQSAFRPTGFQRSFAPAGFSAPVRFNPAPNFPSRPMSFAAPMANFPQPATRFGGGGFGGGGSRNGGFGGNFGRRR